MRDAATDLDFETAARLRDEIKRLREMELAIADDPLAKDPSFTSPQRGSEGRGETRGSTPGGGPQGRMRGSAEGAPALFRKNSLDEMTVGRTEVPLGGATPSKPGDLEPRRNRSGAGSYESAADLKRQKRRPGKTGRPGR